MKNNCSTCSGRVNVMRVSVWRRPEVGSTDSALASASKRRWMRFSCIQLAISALSSIEPRSTTLVKTAKRKSNDSSIWNHDKRMPLSRIRDSSTRCSRIACMPPIIADGASALRLHASRKRGGSAIA